MKKLIAALALFFPLITHAACSGSGLVWSCTAGSTKADVNGAMASATTGATITMAAGAYTWTTGAITPDPLKSVAVVCATIGGCDAALGTSQLWYHDDVNGATNEAAQATWRLSGFDFTGSCAVPCMWIYPRSAQPIQYLTLQLDNNTFANLSDASDFAYLGEGTRPMQFKGAWYRNTWTNDTQTRIVIYGTGNPADWSGSLLGATGPESGNCLYFESNTINFTAPNNAGSGFIDGENTACYVIRFNSFTNARVLQHGVTHGWGTSNFEVYKNTFTRTTNSDGIGNCYRSVHFQGSGTAAFWGNSFTCFGGTSGATIDILHYRDTTLAIHGAGGTEQCDGTQGVDGNTAPTGTHRGYPCFHQPGRAPGGNALYPIPVFLNIDAGSGNAKIDTNFACPWSGTPYCAEHVQADRDYYNAVSATAQTSATAPFNGTTGIGHGILARRPTTCTHNTAPGGDDGGGVMYWATDTGNWNGFTSAPQGLLYRCSATNTWTPYYWPYKYPHPLRVRGGPVAPVVTVN